MMLENKLIKEDISTITIKTTVQNKLNLYFMGVAIFKVRDSLTVVFNFSHIRDKL